MQRFLALMTAKSLAVPQTIFYSRKARLTEAPLMRCKKSFSEQELAVNSRIWLLLQIKIFLDFFDGFLNLHFDTLKRVIDFLAFAFVFCPRFYEQDFLERLVHTQ